VVDINNLGPLDWRIPIVTAEGRPTAEFQRRWATQVTNNSQIGSITVGSGPPPATPIPEDGAQYADTSSTPYTMYIAFGGTWHAAGSIGANPTATAKDTAVNGTATTFMRSDAAPAVQKASSSLFGIVKVDGTTITASSGVISAPQLESIEVACSDESTALTTGTAKVTFRMPFAMTVTEVRASLTTAQASGSIFTVDINEAGTSILSTKLTIDNTELTSLTAATPPVISDTSLANDASMTVDIDQIGNGTAKGLKIIINGTRT